MSLTLKISSLFVRTLAKPLANTIKRNAREHDRFRRFCIGFAQGLHRIDMRMRLGLLQDPEVIERQIAREIREVEALKKKAKIPTVKTKEEMKAEEAMTSKEREEIKKRLERKPRIRPLPEAKAIELGANFVSETFIFTVGIGVILFENWRQRRKARNQRDDIRENLEELQVELKSVKAELEEYKALAHPPPSKLLGFWKGKSESAKQDGNASSEKEADSPPESQSSPSATVPTPSTEHSQTRK